MPLLWLSLAFLAGILLGEKLPWFQTTWLILALIALVLVLLRLSIPRLYNISPGLVGAFNAVSPRSQRFITLLFSSCRLVRFPIPLPVLLAALCLGGWRFQASLPDWTDSGFIAQYNDGGEEVVLQGVVIKPPEVQDTFTNLRLQVDKIRSADGVRYTPVYGLVLVRVFGLEDRHYGDRIVVSGKLETPPEGEIFSYRDYLAHQGIYSYMPYARAVVLRPREGNPFLAAIYSLRERAQATIYQLWPDPEASLLDGILLGIDYGISESLQEDFRRTGTAHVIAISGFNMTIIAGLFVTAFGRLLGRRWGAVAAAVAICAYTLLVGAAAAVVRAALMSGLSLFARQVGRRQDGLNSLAFTAAAMALFNPNVLWDIGFQLSFAATLGLVLYAEALMSAFVRYSSRFISLPAAEKLAGPAGEYLLFTLAAQVTSLPITAFHFGSLSLAAVLANPVILPAQPPVMILGGLAVIMGLLYLPLGRLAAPIAWPFVVYTIRAVELFSRLPQAVLVLGKFSLLTVVLFYAALLAWELKPRLSRLIARIAPGGVDLPVGAPVLALVGVTIAAVLVWRAAWTAPDGRLHLTLLDVSAGVQSGEALLVQTPGGRYLLIDGGPSPSRLSEGLGRRLPLVRRQLDFLVVGTTQQGSLDALPEVIEGYPPNRVLWSGNVAASEGSRQLFQALSETGIPVTTAEAGHKLQLGNGATLNVLACGSRGAILLLEWERFRALLPLGASFEQMESLRQGKEVGPVTALLLADSGYAPLNPPEWIANLRPQLVLLSVAALNQEGLPSPETLAAIEGYTLLRTDRNGWAHLSTDGEQLWVEVEKK